MGELVQHAHAQVCVGALLHTRQDSRGMRQTPLGFEALHSLGQTGHLVCF
jgi:hypothetical protein